MEKHRGKTKKKLYMPKPKKKNASLPKFNKREAKKKNVIEENSNTPAKAREL